MAQTGFCCQISGFYGESWQSVVSCRKQQLGGIVMTDVQRRAAAKQFAADWAGKGYEKGHSQAFWLSLLQKVYGVAEPEKFITFEDQVMLDHTSFIDGSIPATHVLIEQKSLGKELNKPIKQSDGSLLSPFQQAKRYAAELPYSQRPRWIVTCNFAEFYVYDMERPTGDPEIIKLCDLEKEYYRLDFLVDTGNENIQKEMEVSLKAGELVGILYDALLKQYKDPSAPETLKSLNALCVRLVFCLYAEDANVFGSHGMFHNYLRDVPASGIRKALVELFRILDQKPEERDKYLADDNPALAAFPYVNGGLFADESIEIPPFTEELKTLLLEKASREFDWSAISPTIFGATMESTLNPETRRSGGMHYTSLENIHKVIDPLFLDGLKAELEEIKAIDIERTRKAKLTAFQRKLAGLKFLDPACGSGNFLTETYISLRRLENEVLREMSDQITMADFSNPIQVSISQFYGIEINDFAVTVAKTALWIAESQMMKQTEDIIHSSLDFLPLKSYANITEGNALRLDWGNVVPIHELDYIMGNPPFVGGNYQTATQRADLKHIFATAGRNTDYVSGWYFKAAELMRTNSIRTAFVSTNSITQGDQVASIWKPLYEDFGIHIDFAHRTFRWDSEANLKAHVHCVIIGFSVAQNSEEKRLFTGDRVQIVKNINAYLLNAENVFIESRAQPICDVPEIRKGNQPTDGGNLIIEADELEDFLTKEPLAEPYIKKLIGSREFINRKNRYCLWLVGVSPAELRKMPAVMSRVQKVREMRVSSSDAGTKRLANIPTLFRETNNPDCAIVVPEVSSQNRRYVPIGFIEQDVICTNKLQIIPNGTLYHLGVLTSNVHMAWLRAVCGRLKSDYDYSQKIVYNNFPWPTPTDVQVAKIEQTAQAILDARALYPDSSLADLYDDVTMPPELRKAHQQNDRAVMQAYGFDIKTMTEASCVAELMRMYQELTKEKK